MSDTESLVAEMDRHLETISANWRDDQTSRRLRAEAVGAAKACLKKLAISTRRRAA